MNIRNNQMKLINYIRGVAPLIYVVDNDEVHTAKSIRNSCLSLFLKISGRKANPASMENLKYFEWTHTEGTKIGIVKEFSTEDAPHLSWNNFLVESTGGHVGENKFLTFEKNRTTEEITKTQEILDALDIFAALPAAEGKQSIHILVVKDIHDIIRDNVLLIRKIKDIVTASFSREAAAKHIIILNPIKEVPIELANLVNFVEWKLPDEQDISEYLIKRLSLKIVEFGTDGKPTTGKTYTKQEFEQIVKSFVGLPFARIEENTAISFAEKSRRFDSALLYKLKTQNIMENSSLELVNASTSMDQVGGMDTFKQWIEKRRLALTKEALDFGVEAPKGALLLGIQGCGKSLMAQAVASSWNLPLVRMDVAKVFSQTIGSSEQNVRNMLRTVEALAPCVVLIDEIEKGLAGVQSSNFSDGGTTARVVGTLLSWMQDKTAPVFIVATSNDISMLPPELVRKGRFDELFFCSLPEAEERKQIFSIHLNNRKYKPENFNVGLFAEQTPNFSGAEIEQIIKSSILEAFNSKEKKLTDDNILYCIKNTTPLYKTFKKEMQDLIEWVDWDEERNEGIRAIYASSSLKEKRLANIKNSADQAVIDLRLNKKDD